MSMTASDFNSPSQFQALDRTALLEPLKHVFRDFAFLDLEVRSPTDQEFVDWILAAVVYCEGDFGDGEVELMVTPEFGMTVARNYLGASDLPESFTQDILKEATNIIAGRSYEILKHGHCPRNLGPPRLLEPNQAMTRWNRAPSDQRTLILADDRIVGGLVVTLRENME